MHLNIEYVMAHCPVTSSSCHVKSEREQIIIAFMTSDKFICYIYISLKYRFKINKAKSSCTY